MPPGEIIIKHNSYKTSIKRDVRSGRDVGQGFSVTLKVKRAIIELY